MCDVRVLGDELPLLADDPPGLWGGRIKPGRIERAALSLQNQNYCVIQVHFTMHILCFLIRPRLYASEKVNQITEETKQDT